jgi:hypothetical protein
LPNLSQSQQLEEFYGIFGDLLAQLQASNKDSYLFMDANINLLELNNLEPQNYMNLLFAFGFLQSVVKATRIQNISKSLIDHILVNTSDDVITSGIILSDISDHFFTFLCPQLANQSKSNHKMSVSRDFSLPCLNKFKRELSLADWRNVLDSNDVNSAYDCFWSVYNNLFESNFPLKKKRFNKNFNPRNKFMTQGLIIS